MDGGIGESALLGAALSAGTGLISGKGINPLSLALGAGTGALGGYLGGAGDAAASGSTGSIPSLTSAGESAGSQLGMANAIPGITPPSQFTSMFTPSADAVYGGTAAGSDVGTSSGITGLQGSIAPNMSQVNPVDATQAPADTGVSASDVQQAMTTSPANLDVSAPQNQSTLQGLSQSLKNTGGDIKDWWKNLDPTEKMLVAGAGGIGALYAMQPKITPIQQPAAYSGPLSKYHLAANYQATQAMAQGGIAALASGGQMAPAQANVDFMGGSMYPQSQQQSSFYATPTQMPTSAQQAMASYEPTTNPLTGEATVGMTAGGNTSDAAPTNLGEFLQHPSLSALAPGLVGATNSFMGRTVIDPSSLPSNLNDQQIFDALLHRQTQQYAEGGIAGGIANLGSYASGGNPHLLQGPGDGMSDSIPATIADKQPARLATGEFVVPADVVSHLGNGSTDAGAKHLYAMMDKVRKARTGHTRQGKEIDAQKYMPA